MRTAPEEVRTSRRRPCPLGALVVTILIALSGTAFAGLRVVATVKPLHSLVTGVMAGVAAPELIIRGSGSPHTYSLRPSEARLLESAQVIFWIGEPLETFMEQPLAVLGSKALVVKVMQMPGITLYSGRAGGSWDDEAAHDAPGNAHADGEAPGHPGDHGLSERDGHLWLDPANARLIAAETATVLGRVDPGNRDRYAANAAALIARIDALDAELEAVLAPVRDIPYVVFHDAYQYFEQSYALRAVGSVTVSAERKPGARRVREIRDTIRRLGARCVFNEPQFSSAILRTIIEGTDIRTGTLDPLGAGFPAGPDAYFDLMRALGSSFAACLGQR